jgi:predicted NAD/FAD-binding protein
VRVAVVGSGIAGLAAARALAGRAGVEVEVFEAAARAGGHVRTVDVDGASGRLAIDTGFIVYNRANYPRLSRLLDELGVATRPTTMAFSVSLPARDLEWGSASLGAVFADRRRLVDRRHWRFVVAVIDFLRTARRDLGGDLVRRASLDDYVDARRTPGDVRDGFVVPLAAALWSLAPATCGGFPARAFFGFLDRHGMLRPTRPLEWRTIAGGSRSYVDALVRSLGAPVHVGCPVTRIERAADRVVVHAGGRATRLDRAIVATHADTALGLLDTPTPDEARALGAFRYSRNRAVLHRDTAFLPRRPAARASWNYVADRDDGRVAVTYWMNRLQGLPDRDPYLVTLNPRRTPADVVDETWFDHPQFDAGALDAQVRLPALQGTRRTYYAGAHFGFGFHEDGARSGHAAAARVLYDEAATT